MGCMAIAVFGDDMKLAIAIMISSLNKLNSVVSNYINNTVSLINSARPDIKLFTLLHQVQTSFSVRLEIAVD